MAQVLMRCGWSSIVVALALSAGARAGDEWIPLQEGTRFTYRCKTTTRAAVVATSREGKVTATVIRREKIGDAEWFRVEWRDDQDELDGVHWVRSDAQGVQVGRASDDHLLLVPATLTPNTTVAETRVQVGEGTLALKEIKVGQAEKVAAPIGEREALWAESRVEAPAARRVLRVWYARGLGPIKIVETVEAPATKVERELLLTAVEQGAVGGPVEEPGEAPEQPDVEAPETPAPPQKQAGAAGAAAGVAPAALVERARALIRGKDDEWAKLEAAARTALVEAKRAQPQVQDEAPWAGAKKRVKDVEAVSDDLKEARITSGEGFSIMGTVRKSILVVEGTLSVSGNLRDCVVVVLGDLELLGNLHDCLVLVSGKAEIQGNVHDAALACGALEINGNVHDALLQARSLQALGNLHDDVLVGVKSPGGKNNREAAGPDLWAHFAK